MQSLAMPCNCVNQNFRNVKIMFTVQLLFKVSHSVILCKRKRIKQIRSSGLLWNGNVQFFNPCPTFWKTSISSRILERFKKYIFYCWFIRIWCLTSLCSSLVWLGWHLFWQFAASNSCSCCWWRVGNDWMSPLCSPLSKMDGGRCLKLWSQDFWG